LTEILEKFNITQEFNYTSTKDLIDQLPSSYTLQSDYDFVVTFQDYRDLVEYNQRIEDTEDFVTGNSAPTGSVSDSEGLDEDLVLD
jgi:hypothetical protein